MKAKEKKSLRTLSLTDSVKQIQEINEKLSAMHAQSATLKPKNVRESRGLRLKRAMLLTFNKEKELVQS